MKKNGMYKFICSMMVVLFVFSSSVFVQAKDAKTNLSFLAVSDLHLDEILNQTKDTNLKQFKRLLNETKSLNIDLFVGGGDYSSVGDKVVWYNAYNLVSKAGFKNTLWALGNHDYGLTGYNLLTRKYFTSLSKVSNYYYVKEVKGYSFIVLGAENGYNWEFGCLSNAQKEWFKKTLKTVAEKSKGKPIFVVSHFDLELGDMREDFADEMKKYDNVFFLWGHKHGVSFADMSLESCVHYEDNLVIARMGTMHYYNSENADGLIVRIYDDKVELQVKRVSGTILTNDTVTITLKK